MPAKGFKQTEEAKEKIRQANLGKKHTEETRRKISSIQVGKKLSEETKEKMKLSHLGKKYTPMSDLGKQHLKEARKIINEKGFVIWNKGKKTGKNPEHSKRMKGKNPWNKDKKGLQKSWNKGKCHPAVAGEKNNNWKGGITPINMQVRSCFKYRQWRSDIFTRDDFSCVECKARSGNGVAVYLEADHYPVMFSEIMREYNIKSLTEALTCEKLWDINNGRTLCRKCHDKTKWGRRTK